MSCTSRSVITDFETSRFEFDSSLLPVVYIGLFQL